MADLDRVALTHSIAVDILAATVCLDLLLQPAVAEQEHIPLVLYNQADTTETAEQEVLEDPVAVLAEAALTRMPEVAVEAQAVVVQEVLILATVAELVHQVRDILEGMEDRIRAVTVDRAEAD